LVPTKMVKRLFNPDGNQSGSGDQPPRGQLGGNRFQACRRVRCTTDWRLCSFQTRGRSGGDVRTASEPAASIPAVVSRRGAGCGRDRAGSLSVALPAFAAREAAGKSARLGVQGRAQSGIEESRESPAAVAGRYRNANGFRAGSGRAGRGLAEAEPFAGGGEGAAGAGSVLPFAAARR